jgi:hypothetical protein
MWEFVLCVDLCETIAIILSIISIKFILTKMYLMFASSNLVHPHHPIFHIHPIETR